MNIGVRCGVCDTPLYLHDKAMNNQFGLWLYVMPCPKCAAQQSVQPTPESGRDLPVESTDSEGSAPAKSG